MKRCMDFHTCTDPSCPARAAECHLPCAAPRQSPFFAPGVIEGPQPGAGRPAVMGRLRALALYLLVTAVVGLLAVVAGFFRGVTL